MNLYTGKKLPVYKFISNKTKFILYEISPESHLPSYYDGLF